MEVFLIIVGVAISVLNIILFCKIWEMTNNVSDIKKMLVKRKTEVNPENVEIKEAENKNDMQSIEAPKQKNDINMPILGIAVFGIVIITLSIVVISGI